MLEKNYPSIYAMDSFKKRFTSDRIDSYNETTYAIANLLYTSSRECIGYSSNDPSTAQVIVNNFENPLITYLLSYEPKSLDILRELQGSNENKKDRTTALDASIMVCEAYIEKNKTR